MTTAQAAPNGHRVLPPPSSVESPAELNSADLPADQDNINQFAADAQVLARQKGVPITNINSEPLESQISNLPSPDAAPFPASAYHVPPKAFTTSPNPRQPGEYARQAKGLDPLPHRCQFMFSDGRQCTMARSDIHPSLCVYHSEREEQLFGDPFCESRIVGRSYDLPELFSASRDLTTAAGVNRALAQIFRLLAQRRISRQEAATFAKLGHLLLQSIRAARAEALDASLSDDLSGGVILSERSERRISPQFSSEHELPSSPFNKRGPRTGTTIRPGSSSRATNWSEGPLPESALADESKDLSVPLAARPNSSAPPIADSPEPPGQQAATSNSRKINTSAPSVRNSPEISTSRNTQLHPLQNQHLHKHTAPEVLAPPILEPEREV